MADDIARLGYDIDSSRARTAATDLAKLQQASVNLAGAVSKTDAVLRRSNGQFATSAEVVNKYGNEVRSLAAEFNPALNAVYQFQQAETRLNRAIALGVVSMDQKEAALSGLRQQYALTTNGVDNYANSMRRVGNIQGSVGNQFAQLNDIVVTSWGGMNPALIGMQQGMQMVQGFAGQSLPQALKTLGGAFMTLLSPMTLLTVGTIAGGAALIQWGMSAVGASDDGEKLDEILSGLAESASAYADALRDANDPLNRLIEQFGSQAFEAERLLDLMARIQQINFANSIADAVAGLNEQFDDLRGTIGIIDDLERKGAGAELVLRRFLGNLENDSGLAEDQARLLLNALDDLGAATGPIEASKQLEEISRLLIEAKENGGDVPPELIKVAQEALAAALQAQALADALGLASVNAAGIVIPDGAAALGSVRPQMRPMDLGDPEPRRRGGGGGGANRAAEERARDLERFIESLQTEREVLEEWRIEQSELLGQFNDQELEAIGGQNEAKIRLEQEYQERLREIQDQERMSRMQGMQSMFGDLTSLMQSGSAKLFKIGQAAAIANAVVDGWTAATSAWKWGMAAGGPALAAAAAAASLARTGVMIKNIADQKVGGGAGGGGAPSGASTSEQAQPDRVVRVSLNGSAFLAEIIDPIIKQIFEENNDGRRVIVERV